MPSRRFRSVISVPRLVIVFLVIAVVAGTLAAVNVPGSARPGDGVLPAGSQGSLAGGLPWWDPRGWFSPGGTQAPVSHTVPGTQQALAYPAQAVRKARSESVHRMRELTGKRTRFSRTYELSDGRQQAVISAAPVNYRDASGQWEPVSTTVTKSARPGFAAQNTTNSFGSFFSSDPARLVRFEVPGGGWLQTGLAGAAHVIPRVRGNVVTYDRILPGVSLSYVVTPTELKEEIVLASRSAGAALRFTVKAGGGLVPRALRGGGIAWSLGRAGPPLLVVPGPVMADARSAGGPVNQRAGWDAAASVLTQTLVPDREWLDAASRVFPVTVDPTVQIIPDATSAQNTMIEQDSPGTNYSSSWKLEAGTTASGAVRSLLSFPMSSIPAGTNIDSADLNLYWDQSFGTGTTQAVQVYQATTPWSASTVTWNSNVGTGVQGMNQVVVDDSTPGQTSQSGAWPSQPDASAVNGEYLYNQDTTAGDSFTWVPPITEAGTYRVEDHYVANASAASNAPFTVNYSGGSATFNVNQASGTGGQWTTLGSEAFAAGTSGTVVLGDGPASASVRVEADQTRFTKWGSVTDTLASPNRWDSFAVRNIVQGWLSGSYTNDGLVVRAANESALNVGGPVYEAAGNFYNGDTSTYPQLVVTYQAPSVILNPITTMDSTGATLSWDPYTDPTPGTDPGDDLTQYQVYRSTTPSFTPDDSTLVSTVPAGTTTFTDTTAPPAPAGSSTPNSFYYMVAVMTSGSTDPVPGPTLMATLPPLGHTTVILPASGTSTLSSAQPYANLQSVGTGQWLETGDNDGTYGTTRTVLAFPSLSAAIPPTATITDAHLQVWGFQNSNTGGGAATYEAHALTQPFTTSQVSWNSASTGTAWTTAGGTFSTAAAGTVTGLTNNEPGLQTFGVTSIAQGWLSAPSSQDGLLLKLSGEASTNPQENELWLNATAHDPSLVPALIVTYLDSQPSDTYYVPDTPHVSASASSYTTSVTVTNTTVATWKATDWELSYHWLTPDGTDVYPGTVQSPAPLTADLAPGASATLTPTVLVPDVTGTGADRKGYQLLWDMYDKTTGTWLSSGTSTPSLTGTSTASTVGTLNQVTSAAKVAQTLGLEKYFQYTGVATGSGSVLENNDATGNVVWNYNPFSNPSRGFRTFVRLDYNSLDTSESSMGFGWSLQASTLTRLGTPLDFQPPGNPTSVTLTDGNGGSHTFTLNTSVTPSVWTSPPGFHYYLQQEADCKASPTNTRAWLITAPDRTQFWFDCQGYQMKVTDKNGNNAFFTYSTRNSNNQPTRFLDSITDGPGRQTLTISYYTKHQANYQYIDDSGSAPVVVSDTNLTNPDIVDQISSITDVSGRQISFLYDKEGMMAQLTDGPGPSWTGPATTAKVFKFGYDMTQGNKNVKLVSVTDPRGNATALSYNKPSLWTLNTITDRRSQPTAFAYTTVASGNPVLPGGGVQTVVTDPDTHNTTYMTDTTGRTAQISNALGYKTSLGWDSDNNLTSLTEDNGAKTTWTYDPDTGYPLTMKDAQANHDGTAGYTYTYAFSLPDPTSTTTGHVADLTSELTPQQRLTTFTYDPYGNVQTITKPLGNVSGAAAGSYTTTYTYGSYGLLASIQDPNGNTTGYSNYDPTGYPGTITDARNHASGYQYSPAGEVTQVTDALGRITTQQYDAFGRPGLKTTPKSANQTVTIAAPVYDGNDNVTTSYAPSYYAAGSVPPGATVTPGPATTSTYDNDDELASKATPPDSGTGTGPTTTWAYDPAGNLKTLTRPLGNVTGAAPGSYTTTYGYDSVNELKTATDAGNGLTQYGYDDVGNKTSVTDPDTNQTQYGYNLNHQVSQVTDANGKITKTQYDLDGLTTQVTDANSNTTYYTLDADGQVIQQQVPAQAPGSGESCPTSSVPPAAGCDVTQYVYDQDGNKVQVLTPLALKNGNSTASTCASPAATTPCPYSWMTTYNPDNQVASQITPPGGDTGYTGAQTTSYSYDWDGRPVTVTSPGSNDSPAVPDTTQYVYTFNGWVTSSTDPRGITTSYNYDANGEQDKRTISSAGSGDMARTMIWGYFPDGKLQSVSDSGIPTGLNSEVVDNTDTANVSATSSGNPGNGMANWPSSSCPAPASSCDGYSYQTHASATAGSGPASDTFTWRLNIPAAGKYNIYVKYPSLPSGSTAATSAPFKVTYSGGSATVNVNQQASTGTWYKLGEYQFAAGTGQQVSLTPSTTSGNTVVAGAVKAVSDTTGVTDTANNTYTYAYDADGNQKTVTETDALNGNAVLGSDAITSDQLDRTTGVWEYPGSSGTASHCTGYGYDAASNMNLMVHDLSTSTLCSGYTAGSGTVAQYSAYGYNNLNQLKTESDGTSATDPSPKVASFTYTPTGQASTETKPNSNLVTDTYYGNDQLDTQTEKTSGGSVVAAHTYSYDANGNQTQDIQQLMSADSGGGTLNRTYNDTYNPLNQLTGVTTTDNSDTETYTHDPAGNVTSQTINNATATFCYDRGLLETTTTGTSCSATPATDYNYDALGRLDTITSASSGTVLESSTYDGFDNLTTHTQGTAVTTYKYDPLNRPASETTGAGTTSYSYLGLTSQVASENDPAGVTKSYTYTPGGGLRVAQTTSGTGATDAGTVYYSYNNHGDAEALTAGGTVGTTSSGNTVATYGYTAYGSTISGTTTGADKGDTSPSPTSTPYNSYRYNGMRWDVGSGQYDMGFRNYDSGLNAFTSRDMYNGALNDMGLTTDPFTGSRYAFGEANPISNIEADGHMIVKPFGGDCGLSGMPACPRAASQPNPQSNVPPFPGLSCSGPTCNSALSLVQNLSGYTSADQCFLHASFFGCLQTLIMAAPVAGKAGDILGALGVDVAKAGSGFEAAAGGVWGLGPGNRGMAIENIYADQVASANSRLPVNFKTFDFFDQATGIATSLKSINLADSTYQSGSKLLSALKSYINATADFTGYSRGGVTLAASDIRSRALTVAIPDVWASRDQYEAMYNAYQYGAQQGVAVQFLTVTGR